MCRNRWQVHRENVVILTVIYSFLFLFFFLSFCCCLFDCVSSALTAPSEHHNKLESEKYMCSLSVMRLLHLSPSRCIFRVCAWVMPWPANTHVSPKCASVLISFRFNHCRVPVCSPCVHYFGPIENGMRSNGEWPELGNIGRNREKKKQYM